MKRIHDIKSYDSDSSPAVFKRRAPINKAGRTVLSDIAFSTDKVKKVKVRPKVHFEEPAEEVVTKPWFACC